MAVAGLSTMDVALVAFDDHLRRVQGVCPEVRRSYGRVAREFLEMVFGDGPVDLARLSASDAVQFAFRATVRYRPSTLQGVTTALRSFLRFLRVEGVRDDRLEEAVLKVPLWRLSAVPRHLGSGELARLIASLDERSSPTGLRDRAMLLLAARLGLRASEIARLGLEDIDWRSGTVQIRTRKTGHGALLPLPREVGKAIATYLQCSRPASEDRHVFLLHQQQVGAPIDRHVVGDAVRRALDRAGIDAPVRRANLLRHSLATDPLAHGASLKEIADLFGHRALSSTQVYAKVDIVVTRGRAALARSDAMTASFAERVEQYVAMRRGLGYRLDRQATYLRSFAAFLDRCGHDGPVPLALSVQWATATRSHDPHNPARRLSAVGGFLRYLAPLDGATEIPPPGLLGPSHHRTPSHIYSDQEIESLLAAAAVFQIRRTSAEAGTAA